MDARRQASSWYEDLAIAQNRPECTFALATLSLDGTRPEVRNVGIKRMIALTPQADPDRQALLCTTDVRTPKVAQLLKNPECSLSCWIPEESLQVRVQAKARTFGSAGWNGEQPMERVQVDLEALRQEMFVDENFRSRTRAWHANPTPGDDLGLSREGWIENLAYSDGHRDDAGSPIKKSFNNFALIIFEPYEVDVVRMFQKGFDQRTKWSKNANVWSAREVVP